jgi:HD-GYP domain-containing protein (c-di-GMP phosphodiesterase class II)
MTETGAEATDDARSAAIAHLLANAGEIMTDIIDTRCTRGADIARQLRFSERVADAIAHLDEHWDGGGLPSGTLGEAIPVGARIALLAQVADVFYTAGGPHAACAEIMRRSGSWLDPQLADTFLALAKSPAFWAALSSDKIEQQLFALEPAMHRVTVDEDYLDDIAAAFGQVIDAKSPFTGGHSERVGLFADLIAERLGINDADRRSLRRAAILHDVGKLGVSSRILEKPGNLDAEEWGIIQGHAQQTTIILSRIGVMRDMAMIAGSHHERLDGKGYPLGLDATMISIESRIITVADFFDALTADRPYRTAMTVEQALPIMADEVGTAIDATCFAALSDIVRSGIPQKPLPTIARLFH